MGLWFKKYPAHFLDGAYLRYVGWVLSDAQTQVRLEAVRALALAYDQTAYIGAAALQHFTERFKPRLVEMAVGDIELSVRVAVVQVLQTIDGHGLLEDEQRQKLCLLVFDEEPRVRRAVSGFVKGVWEETVDERLVGRKPSDTDKSRAGVKALGVLLVTWGRALDKSTGDGDGDDESDLGEGTSKRVRAKEVASLVGHNPKGRTALVAEALWDEVEPVRDWETLLDVLLLDHSAAGEGRPTSRSKGKQTASDEAVDEAYRLEEVEEAVLVEMLVATLRKALADAATVTAKKVRHPPKLTFAICSRRCIGRRRYDFVGCHTCTDQGAAEAVREAPDRREQDLGRPAHPAADEPRHVSRDADGDGA